jgi:hypothetical protein
MRNLGSLLVLIVLPLAVLNLLGGVVGTIWLVLTGHWQLPILALVVGLIAAFGIALALLPGLAVGGIGVAISLKSNPFFALPFLIASSVWTYGVMYVWSWSIFMTFQNWTADAPLLPTLLLSYATAVAPWAHMTQKESRSNPDDMSGIPTFFCQIGCAAALIFSWKNGLATPEVLTPAIAIPLALGLLVQLVLSFVLILERRRFAY